jgi:hypothetical protein
MKRVSLLLLILLPIIFLTACGGFQFNTPKRIEATQIMQTRTSLERKFNEVVLLISSAQKESTQKGTPIFTEEEYAELSNLYDSVDLIITKMETIRSSYDLTYNSDSLLSIVNMIEESYVTSAAIVDAKKSSFTDVQRVRLMVFDELARKYWGDVKTLLENPTDSNIYEAFFIASELLDTTLTMLRYLGAAVVL